MDYLLLLAVCPPALLMFFIIQKDKVEKEPPGLLTKLLLLGAVSTISAIILEMAGIGILGLFLSEESTVYILLENFLVVALSEEAGKYFVLKKCTWKHPAFNYTFDGIVYAVASSLGFATLENILYVVQGGLETGIARAFLSIPGHTIFGIYMGLHYGIARREASLENTAKFRIHKKLALIVPVLLHGTYDFCLSMESGWFILLFMVFEVVVTCKAFHTIRTSSAEDTPILQVPPDMELLQDAPVSHSAKTCTVRKDAAAKTGHTPAVYGIPGKEPYVQPHSAHTEKSEEMQEPIR